MAHGTDSQVAGQWIEGMTPTVHVPAMLSFEAGGTRQMHPIVLIGIDEKTYASVSDFGKYLQHPENRSSSASTCMTATTTRAIIKRRKMLHCGRERNGGVGPGGRCKLNEKRHGSRRRGGARNQGSGVRSQESVKSRRWHRRRKWRAAWNNHWRWIHN